MATRQEMIEAQRLETRKILEEIIVIRNLLIKFDFECAETDRDFVAFLAEAGITNTKGTPITYMGYRQMIERADKQWMREFIENLYEEPVAFRFQG